MFVSVRTSRSWYQYMTKKICILPTEPSHGDHRQVAARTSKVKIKLTLCSRVILEILNNLSAGQQISLLLWYTTAHFRVQKRPRNRLHPEQDESSPQFLTLYLILSSHLWQILLSGLFPSGYPTKFLYTCHFFHRCYMILPLILLDFITVIIFPES
jgi:hypothetical protein